MRATVPWLSFLLLAPFAASPASATDQKAPVVLDTTTIPVTQLPGMAPDGTAQPELVAQLRRIQEVSFPEAPLPMGVWLKAGGSLVYSYMDSEAGASVAGEMSLDGMDGDQVHMITRTSTIGGMTQLTEAERAAAGLPVEPKWLKGYGPQPPRGSLWGVWRSDPRLAGRFHPDYPDDLQVWVYAGTLKKMRGKPELVWVRLWSCEEDRCQGHMLNEPFAIKSMHEGDMVWFGKDTNDEFLVMLPPGSP